MRQRKTAAVILNTTDVFDADRSFLLFTRELGKVRARAKGVRKPTSKLTGHLLAYLPTQLELIESGSGFLIVQAQVESEYAHYAAYPENSLLFMRQASIIAETVNRIYPDQEAHQEVYEGLVYTLDRLRALCEESDSVARIRLVTGEFLLKALAVLGYRPSMDACVVTGEPLQESFVAWNSLLGGALSERGWQESGRQGIVIRNPRSLVVLRQLLREVFTAERLSVDDEVKEEACSLLYDYVQTHIGQPLRALQ